jgi:hypothetical protein
MSSRLLMPRSIVARSPRLIQALAAGQVFILSVISRQPFGPCDCLRRCDPEGRHDNQFLTTRDDAELRRLGLL